MTLRAARRSLAAAVAIGVLLGSNVPVVAVGSVSAGDASPAAASAGWAAWTLAGSGHDYSGTVSFPATSTAFPSTTWRSDSRTASTASNAWVPPGSPAGAVFGSGSGSQYLSLHPSADNADGPSTTTYTFASPPPVGAWGMVLSDIDAETLLVTAVRASDGQPATVAELGFQGVMNLCDASPRSSACSGQVPPYNLPDSSTTATGVLLTGNVSDSEGAAGWLMPTVPLASLTVVDTWRTGLPAYQTWFAVSETFRLSGTARVTGVGPFTGAATVRATIDAVVHTTTTDPVAGTYAFDGVPSGATYSVALIPPAGGAVDPASRTGTVSGDTGGLDFRVWLPQAVTFPAPAPGVVGSVATLTASASSGLPVAFSAASPQVCAVSGDQVTYVAAGDCRVVASQPGNEAYAAAVDVTQTVAVTALPPVRQRPLEPIGLPKRLRPGRTTTVVDHPVRTNAGQVAAVVVRCVLPRTARGTVAPSGDVSYCRVIRSSGGVVRVRVYGHVYRVRVVVHAPASDGYTAFTRTRVYRGR